MSKEAKILMMPPEYPAGTRVIAFSHKDERGIYVYGHGEYLGKRRLDEEGLPKPMGGVLGLTGSCIHLDNGQYIWGSECWWGPEEVVLKYANGLPHIPANIEVARRDALSKKRRD